MGNPEDDNATGHDADAPEFDAAVDGPGAEPTTEECASDRDGLTARETADCAGGDLVKEFDNEEDGGS
jgi:hypothetical protein